MSVIDEDVQWNDDDQFDDNSISSYDDEDDAITRDFQLNYQLNKQIEEKVTSLVTGNSELLSESEQEIIDSNIEISEIWSSISKIVDPEYPYTLCKLEVIRPSYIHIENIEITSLEFSHTRRQITCYFKPTVGHCSLATLIGLCLQVKLRIDFPNDIIKVLLLNKDVHEDYFAVNKQINDKERMTAALENENLCKMVEKSIFVGETY